MMNAIVNTTLSAGATLGLALTVQQGAPEAMGGPDEVAPEKQEIWLRSNPVERSLDDSSSPVLELKSRSSDRRPKSQKIKVQLQLERPEDLAVQEGDRVLAGEVLADQSSTRRGLELQKQQLVISIDQMAVPVAPIGELPPPDFGVEESAIVAAKSAIATMEAAPEKRTRFLAPELTEAWDEDVAEWNWQVKAKQVESQVEMNRAVAQYQRAQSSYAWQQYQHGLNLQRQQETRQRQQFQVASLQADLWAVEQKLRELTTVRAPYDGTVQRVKVVGQQGRMLQVELMLLAEISDAEG